VEFINVVKPTHICNLDCETWCDFFLEHDFSVSMSIDGPIRVARVQRWCLCQRRAFGTLVT